MYSVVLVRYGEIALKSPFVRKNLERKLRQNLVSLLHSKSIPFDAINYDMGRFFIYTKEAEVTANYVADHVFGVVSTSPCFEVKNEIPSIRKGILLIAERILPEKATFAISARRTGEHTFTSQDIAVEGGNAILETFKKKKLKVNLSKPDYTIYVETRQKSTYLYHSIHSGLGGLPGKTQGRLVGLVNDDTSSILAIWLAMRRGGVIDLVFFRDSSTDTQKIISHAKLLLKFLPEGQVTLREFESAEEYEQIKKKFPAQSSLLWRRYQIRVISNFASKRKALGIIVGDVLSENSSATLEWIQVSDAVSTYPIYRPLLVLPKEVINQFWQRISPSKEFSYNFEIPLPPPSRLKFKGFSEEEVIKMEKVLGLDDREVLERIIQYKLNEEG